MESIAILEQIYVGLGTLVGVVSEAIQSSAGALQRALNADALSVSGHVSRFVRSVEFLSGKSEGVPLVLGVAHDVCVSTM